MTVAADIASVSGARPFFYLLIEGIGVREGTGMKQLYTFSRMPPWSPAYNQRFIGGLHIPGATTQSGDLWGGLADGGSLKVEMQDFQQADGTYFWCSLFATGKWVESPNSYPQAFLTKSLTPEGATVVDGSLMYCTNNDTFPGDGATSGERTLFLGLETIRYEAKGHYPGATSGGTTVGEEWWFEDLTRGLFPCVTPDTIHALEHRIHDTLDASQPVITTHPRIWVGRMASLYMGLEYPDGTWSLEADSLRLFTGPIQQPEWEGKNFRWTLELLDLVGYIKQRQCCTWIGSPLTEAPTADEGDSDGRARTEVVGQSLIRGVNMDPADRQRLFAIRVDTHVETMTPYDYYPESADLAQHIDSTIPTWFDATTEAVCWFTQTTSASTLRVLNKHAGTRLVRVRIGSALAIALGYIEKGVQSPDEDYVSEADVESGAEVEFVSGWAPAERCAVYTPNHVSVKMAVESFEQFLDAPQGDNVNPAILVGGEWLMRHGAKTRITRAENPYVRDTLLGDQALYIATRTRSQANDYGTNHWPAGMWGAMYRPDDEDTQGASLKQVLAPNPDSSWRRQMVRLLVSTGYGINGSDDVYPSGIGAGVWSELVDAQSFYDTQIALAQEDVMRRSFVFQGAFSPGDLLDKEGKLVGAMFVVRNAKLTARVVPTLASSLPAAAVSLTNANKDSPTDRTSSTLPPKNIINAVKLLFNWDIQDGKYRARANLAFPVSQSENQLVRSQSLESRGLYGDWWNTLGQALLTSLALRQHLYGWPLWTIRRTINYNLWGLISPGDICSLTDNSVPNPFTGGIGVTGVLLAVTSVENNFARAGGNVEGVILNMKTRLRNTAPVALLDYDRADGGWDSTTRTMYFKANEYTTAPDTDRDSFGDDLDSWLFRVVDTSATNPDDYTAYVLSHPTLSTQYTNGITLIPTVDEGDLNAQMPGGFVNGHRYVVTADHYVAYDISSSGELPGGLIYDFEGAVGTGSEPTQEAYIADSDTAMIDADHPTPWDPFS